jgi:hypothetical protein
MRLWPFGGGEDRRSAEAALSPPPPPPFRSWALSDVLRRRQADRAWRVLDLGSANPINLAFFAARGATYTVEELWATVAGCRTAGVLDAARMRALPDLLSFSPATQFDAIFAWDLVDFVGPGGAAVIGERLAPHCHSRTLLYLAVSREPRIAAQPGHWEVVDGETVLHLPATPGGVQACPRFLDSSLLRAFSSFRIHKSYLLKHGLQEYLLEPAG